MSILREEINKRTAPPAVFVLKKDYYGEQLKFHQVTPPSPESNDPIEHLISKTLIVKFNGKSKRNIIDREETLDNARYRIHQYFKEFLVNYLQNPSPRMTNTYQWVERFVGTDYFKSYSDLEEDVVNIFKYLCPLGHSKGSEATENGIKLLEFIKQKYEGKGLIDDRRISRSRKRRK